MARLSPAQGRPAASNSAVRGGREGDLAHSHGEGRSKRDRSGARASPGRAAEPLAPRDFVRLGTGNRQPATGNRRRPATREDTMASIRGAPGAQSNWKLETGNRKPAGMRWPRYGCAWGDVQPATGGNRQPGGQRGRRRAFAAPTMRVLETLVPDSDPLTRRTGACGALAFLLRPRAPCAPARTPLRVRAPAAHRAPLPVPLAARLALLGLGLGRSDAGLGCRLRGRGFGHAARQVL